MHPEIRDTLRTTGTWMREKHFAQYAALDDTTQTTLMQSPEHRTLALAIDTHALTGDVVQTKAACRAYLRYWREILKAHESSRK